MAKLRAASEQRLRELDAEARKLRGERAAAITAAAASDVKKSVAIARRRVLPRRAL